MAESSFRPGIVNRRTGAVGLLQILPEGGANPWGFTKEELKNPWLNADLGARYLARCLTVCRSIGKALGRYHGNKQGCVEDEFSRRVVSIINNERES